jgi:methyl-accepting chemotaxis protein
MFRNIRLNVKLFIAVLTVCIIGLGILVNFLLSGAGSLLKEKSLGEVEENARFQCMQIGTELNIAMESARGLGSIFNGYLNFNILERRPVFSHIIKNNLENNPNFLCVWGIFGSNSIDGFDSRYANTSGSTTTGRFCPSFYRNSDGSINEELEVLDDNELSEEDYVRIPTQRLKETILEPYYYSYSEDKSDSIFETTIAVPIFTNGKLLGITGIDFDLKRFQQYAAVIKPYESGYAILISNEGIIVYHPDSKLIGQNIKDQSFGGKEIAEKILKGGSFSSLAGGKDEDSFELFYNPLAIGNSETPWSLAVAVPSSKIMEPVEKLRSNALIISLLVLGGIILVLLLVTYSINSSFLRVRDEMNTATKNILEGNLSADYNANKVNIEFRPILDGLGEVTGNFKIIVERIRAVSNTIHSTSKQFIEASEELNESADRQSKTTIALSEVMSDMQEKINKNGGNAKETERISLKASKSIALTNIKLKESQDAMHDIAAKVSIINDISFQTNILALNAAVEAARAGEHGRGFSVVAGEVKKLADRSKVAAEEIQTLMKNAVEHSDSAMKRMEVLVPEIDRTSKLVSDISNQSIEQTTQASDAGQTLHQLNKETLDHTDLLTKITDFSLRLESEALELEKLVAKYTA